MTHLEVLRLSNTAHRRQSNPRLLERRFSVQDDPRQRRLHHRTYQLCAGGSETMLLTAMYPGLMTFTRMFL